MAVATVCISGINDCAVISAFMREKGRTNDSIRREIGAVLSATKDDIMKVYAPKLYLL